MNAYVDKQGRFYCPGCAKTVLRSLKPILNLPHAATCVRCGKTLEDA